MKATYLLEDNLRAIGGVVVLGRANLLNALRCVHGGLGDWLPIDAFGG